MENVNITVPPEMLQKLIEGQTFSIQFVDKDKNPIGNKFVMEIQK